MFFKNHGQIQYDILGNEMPLTDITKSSIVLDTSKIVLQTVDVGARTPEQVADDIYGDPQYFWTILLINNIVDPFTDWYMSEDQLYEYCIRIYGSEEEIMKVKYFENTVTNEIITGDESNTYFEMMENGIQLPEHIMHVTFYAYEQLLNEKKKVINVIPESSIVRFVEDTKLILRGK